VNTPSLIEPTPDQLASLKRWRVSTFWVMLIGYIGYYMCRKNLSAAFPLLEDAFGYTNAQLGLIALYSEIAYAVGKFVNGPLGDRVGGRRIFLIGMAGAIALNLVFAQMQTLTAFIVVWCVCRYFLSMGWGGIVKTMGAWYEPERNGTIMGFISVNFQFGGVVAVLFAGYLVSLGKPWQALFLYPAGVLALILLWSLLASRASPGAVVPNVKFGHGELAHESIARIEEHGEQPRIRDILSRLFRVPLFRHLLFFSFLTTALRSIFFFWTPKFLADIGMGHTNAILKSALFPFMGCLGTVLLGWYTDRYARDGDRGRMMWIMLVCLGACLAGVAALAPYGLEHANAIVVLIGFAGFFLLGPYSMSSGCLTLDIAGPKGAGSCSGMIDGVGYLGGALAAWGTGQLSDLLGWPQVFGLLTAIGLASAVSAWFMSREFRRLHFR
jgi:sugar phosphate permease